MYSYTYVRIDDMIVDMYIHCVYVLNCVIIIVPSAYPEQKSV